MEGARNTQSLLSPTPVAGNFAKSHWYCELHDLEVVIEMAMGMLDAP